MNKSKFLKKSLAALLAILMVVAMIPLSAAAEEAPEEPGVPTIAAPDVTVNNRNTTKPQQAGEAYTVTVQDATSVSMAWVPVKDEEGNPYSAQVVTARDVTIGVPFNMLDLLQEGKVIEENTEANTVTYQVTFQVVDKDKEVVGEWPLNITVVNTVPNDDTTIKAVVANQSFRDGATNFAFLGIKGDIDNTNETITITLPLGMTPADAGFGSSSANFGKAGTVVEDNNENIDGLPDDRDIAKRVAPAGGDGEVDTYARKVFVPTSVYTSVSYKAPADADGAGKLVVTARDGRTRNYTVNFVQEEAFENIGVSFGDDGTYYASNKIVNYNSTNQNIQVEYIIPVPEKLLKPKTNNVTYYDSSIVFTLGGNVVRVEDPVDAVIADVDDFDADKNVPLLSGKNTQTIDGTHQFKRVGTSNVFNKEITVKTEANMAPNKTGDVNDSFFQNVKITLKPKTGSTGSEPKLTEFQLNGYDSKWNNGEELPESFEYWVDYDFEFSTGDGQHPARISATIQDNGAISIPAQDRDLVANSYWAVDKTSANGDRMEKPNTYLNAVTGTSNGLRYHFIDNLNTEGGTFVLRVWAGENYKDYTITLRKPTQNTGTAVTGVKLMKKNSAGVYETLQATKSADGRVWTFEVPTSGTFGGLLGGTGTTTTTVFTSDFIVNAIASTGAGTNASPYTFTATTDSVIAIDGWGSASTNSAGTAKLEFAAGAADKIKNAIVAAKGATNSPGTAVTATGLELETGMSVGGDGTASVTLSVKIGGTATANAVQLASAPWSSLTEVPGANPGDPSTYTLDFKNGADTIATMTMELNAGSGDELKWANGHPAITDVNAIATGLATITPNAVATTAQWDTLTIDATTPGAGAAMANVGEDITLKPLNFTLTEGTNGADSKAAIQEILNKKWSALTEEPALDNVSFYLVKNGNNDFFIYAKMGSESVRIGVANGVNMTADSDTAVDIYTPDESDEGLQSATKIGELAYSDSGVAWNTASFVANFNDPEKCEFNTKATYVPGDSTYEWKTGAAGGDLGVISSVADDTLIIVDTPLGSVVTPGGEYNTRRTPVVGVSTWGVGNGFNEQFREMTASTVGAGYRNSNNLYEELEEGVTTLYDWWNVQAAVNGATPYKYLINMGANIAAQNNIEKDGMIFSVKNGRNGQKQPYVIRFKKKAAPSTVAGSEIKANAATTAIDEDLVYGSSTVTNAVIVKNSNIVSNLMKAFEVLTDNVAIATVVTAGDGNDQYDAANLGAPTQNNSQQTAGRNEYFNPGYIDPANAAYIGAIGGHNEFLASEEKITVAKVPDTKKEYVITVHVPADFKTSNDKITKNDGAAAADTVNAPGAIFFTSLTASEGAKVYRAGVPNAATVWTEGKRHPSGNLTKFVLSGSTQRQQSSPLDSKAFQISDNDLLAWKGGVFDSSKVSQSNILYVYNQDNKNTNQPTDGATVATKPAHVSAEDAFDAADAVYYVTVVRDADQTGDQLVSVSSASDNVTANVNQALKTVTVNVPASYNWIGTRDNASHDFQLNFNTSDGAILIDAVNDDAFGFRDNGVTVDDANYYEYKNFSLTDLVQQEQDINKWVSADKDAANATKFFVKDNELFMYNENTGSATQVTGMGDEIKDAYINPSWRLIMDQEAELRVYPESRSEVNTYKLTLNILPESSIATLTHVQVNESTAEIDNDARTAKVELPQGTDLKAVRISVGVNGLSHVVSVAGETYDPNNNTTYDLTNPIAIVIEAENGTQVTYTLTAGDLPSTPAEAEITKLTVDGVEAEVNNTARTAAVELPEGSDLSKVKLAIEVSEGDKLVSVAGEEFDAEAEYDLSSPIAIVIEAEDGTKYDYTLTGTVAKPVEPVNPADKYTDLDKIQKEETRDEVKKAINLGLMNGISESKGIFGVGMKMQRFQFALVVARADLREKLLAEDENADVTVNTLDAKLVELYPDNYTFTDVSEKIELKAAAAAVQYCYDKGYINGKSLANKIFDPTGNITREEAAKIMVLWAGLEHEDTDVSAIPDGDEISNWAKGYVKAAADAGIMKGRTDGNFDPKGDLQRQDGACLLVRTYENYIVKADEDETPDDGDDDNDDNNNGDDDTNNPGDDDENNGGDTSDPDDDTSSTPEDGDDNSSSTPDGEDDNSSSTPDEDNESQPAE